MENWIPMVNATIADNRSVSQRRLSCEDPDSRISYSTWRGPALMPLVTENCASCESRTWFCSSSNAKIREVHTAAAVTTRSIREESAIDRIAPSLNIILGQRPGACWPPSGPSPAQSKSKTQQPLGSPMSPRRWRRIRWVPVTAGSAILRCSCLLKVSRHQSLDSTLTERLDAR